MRADGRDYAIRVHLFPEYKLVVLECAYGEYIWDRDKLEYGELEDLIGKGLAVGDPEELLKQVAELVGSCVSIINGKIVVRAPALTPSRIDIEMSPTKRVSKIVEQMKSRGGKDFEKWSKAPLIIV